MPDPLSQPREPQRPSKGAPRRKRREYEQHARLDQLAEMGRTFRLVYTVGF